MNSFPMQSLSASFFDLPEGANRCWKSRVTGLHRLAANAAMYGGALNLASPPWAVRSPLDAILPSEGGQSRQYGDLPTVRAPQLRQVS